MNIEEAIVIATNAHAGQVDKAGEPYIRHPLRVMEAAAPDPDAMIVAVLHDVIEDTEVGIRRVPKGWALYGHDPAPGWGGSLLTRAQGDALAALTRGHDGHEGESYKEFIDRVADNELATKVKVADVYDNLNRMRMGGGEASLSTRYGAALARLMAG